MSLQYGLNITASNMKKILEENDKQQSGIRSWRQLFGNASLGYEAQSGALQGDYASAMAEAYKANLAQRDTAMNAGYNLGATKELIGASRNDLTAAYNTYIRNYANDQSSLATNYQNEWNALDNELTARAENFAKIYSSAYDYLSKELYGSTFMRDGEEVNVLKDQGLDWLYLKDEAGNPTKDIMSWDELSRQLFNEDGSLNRTGIRFYDQMFNTAKQGWTTSDGNAVRSFDQWLSDTYSNDKEWGHLRDWWLSQDAHNYNLTGTNRGTGQSIIGLEGKDQLYTPGEHMSNIKSYSFDDDILTRTANVNSLITKATEATDTFEKIVDLIGGGANSDKEEYKDKAMSAITELHDAKLEINTVLNDFSKNYTDTLKELKASFGPAVFDEFYTTNKSLFDALDTNLSTLLKNSTVGDVKDPHQMLYDDVTNVKEILSEYATALDTQAFNKLISDYQKIIKAAKSYTTKGKSGF